jgi:hypothetical protein
MGLVLAFQVAPRAASKTPQVKRAEPARSADILFFTGVRYERASAAHIPAPSRAADAADRHPAS